MKRKLKKSLSVFLSLVIALSCISILPISASADWWDDNIRYGTNWTRAHTIWWLLWESINYHNLDWRSYDAGRNNVDPTTQGGSWNSYLVSEWMANTWYPGELRPHFEYWIPRRNDQGQSREMLANYYACSIGGTNNSASLNPQSGVDSKYVERSWSQMLWEDYAQSSNNPDLIGNDFNMGYYFHYPYVAHHQHQETKVFGTVVATKCKEVYCNSGGPWAEAVYWYGQTHIREWFQGARDFYSYYPTLDMWTMVDWYFNDRGNGWYQNWDHYWNVWNYQNWWMNDVYNYMHSSDTSAVGYTDAVMRHYVPNYDYARSTWHQELYDTMIMIQYYAYANWLNHYMVNGYDLNDLAGMQWLLSVAESYYNVLANIPAGEMNVFERRMNLYLPNIANWINQLRENISMFSLREIKNVHAPRDIASVGGAYNSENVRSLNDWDLGVLLGNWRNYVNVINTASTVHRDAVFPQTEGGTAYITSFLAMLEYEASRRDVALQVAGYVQFFEGFKVASNDYTTKTADFVIERLDEAGAKRDAFINLSNQSSTWMSIPDFSTIFGNYLNDNINPYIDEVNQLLMRRLELQVEVGMDLYREFNEINWENFSTIKRAVELIEDSIFNRYNGSGYMTEPTRSNYLFLLGLKAQLDSFGSTYVPTSMEYPVREVRTDSDVARTVQGERPSGEDYKIDVNLMEGMIDKLENLLRQGDFMALLGLEDGIDGAFKNVLYEDVFTNETINMVVDMLYPMITELISDELVLQLPMRYPVDIDISFIDKIFLDIFNGGKSYMTATPELSMGKTAREIAEILGLYAYPGSLAQRLPDSGKLGVIKSRLLDTSNPAHEFKFNLADYPGMDPAFPDWAKFGNNTNWDIFRNAEGDFDFDWGVEDYTDYESRKAAFMDAMTYALSGLETIMQFIICNKPATKLPIVDNVATAEVNVFNVATIDVDADIELSITGMPVYQQVIMPIYEMLGLKPGVTPWLSIPSSDSNTRTILNHLFEPLFSFADKVADAPLSTVLEIMPNLSYNMALNKIIPLFDGLNMDIRYDAGLNMERVNYFASLYGGNEIVYVDDLLNSGGVFDMVHEYFGDMNNLIAMLPDTLGIDYGEEGEKLDLPIFNSGLVATLGTGLAETSQGSPIKLISSVRKGDVLLYLLEYIFSSLDDETMNGLFTAMFRTGGNTNELLDEVIADVSNNAEDAIAAFVELMYPADYSFKGNINWIKPVENYNLAYLSYANNWSQETAEYVADNLNEIVEAILELSNTSLGDLTSDFNALIDELFDAEILKDIAKSLSGIELDDTVKEIIKTQFGVDLESWTAYDESYDPQIENRYEFMDELYTLLEPFAPLMAFILAGEDMRAYDLIHFKGYNGYAYGIVPLLEALDCSNILTPTQYATKVAEDPMNALKEMINPIFAKLDQIAQDPISGLIDTLPRLIYFLSSGGLDATIKNSIHALYVIIDTIRPFYDVTPEMLVDLLSLEDFIVSESFDESTINWIIGLIEEETGLKLKTLANKTINDIVKLSEPYNSSVLSEAYTLNLEKSDSVTVLFSMVFELLRSEENREAVADMMNIETSMLSAIVEVLSGVSVDLKEINWFYFAEPGINHDDIWADYENVMDYLPEKTISHLTYPNNWTEETADFVEKNLDGIISAILKQTSSNSSIAEMFNGIVSENLYNDSVVNSIIGGAQSLIKNIDDALLELAQSITGIDLEAFNSYNEDTVWGVKTKDDFLAAISEGLKPIEPIINWLLAGEDIGLLHPSGNAELPVEDPPLSLITIKGGYGYAKGVLPLYEALGCKTLMSPTDFINADFEDKITVLFGTFFDWAEELFEDPVNNILAILPNLIYFINADGVTSAVQNFLGAIYNVAEAVTDEDIDEVFDFTVSDLKFPSLLNYLSKLLDDVNFEPVIDALSSFYIGEITAFVSANESLAFKMSYSDAQGRKDMITIVLSLFIQMLDHPDNTEIFKDLLGEEAFAIAKNILNLDKNQLEMQKPDWLFTNDADSDKIYTGIESSTIFDCGYGMLWTRDKAEYISKNITRFIDNVIHLLGIELNGISIDSLEALLSSYLGDNIINQNNFNWLLNIVKDFAKSVDELEDSEYLKEFIKSSIKVDFDAWDNIDESSFNIPEGDNEAFIDAVTELLAPLQPILTWLLANENISFFVDKDAKDYIVLPGAQGYAYGIIPILEALNCDPDDILTPAQFEAQPENMIRNILVPILNKLEKIHNNPAEELFEMLPGIIYFINSKGLDASFKNLLNPIYTVLNAIDYDVDFYDLMGISLESFTFDDLMAMFMDDIEEALGDEYASLAIDFVAEFTVGRVVSYTSKNGEKAYTMKYASDSNRGDMVTILLRMGLGNISLKDNATLLKAWLEDRINPEAYYYVASLIDSLAYFWSTESGIDIALGSMYYVAFGVFIATNEVRDVYDKLNKSWLAVVDQLSKAESGSYKLFYSLLMKFYDKYPELKDIISPEGIAPNGFIRFFQSMFSFFQKIYNFLFGRFAVA